MLKLECHLIEFRPISKSKFVFGLQLAVDGRLELFVVQHWVVALKNKKWKISVERVLLYTFVC